MLACDDLIRRECEARMSGDDAGGLGIIPRHHHHFDAGGVAIPYRLRHFGPHRILHARESEKDEVKQALVAVSAVRGRRDFAFGKPQDTQPPGGQFVLLKQQRFAFDGHDPIAHIHAVSHRNQGFRRALDEDADPAPMRMKRGGVSQVGLVGDTSNHWIALADLIQRDPALAGCHQQSHINGVARPRPVAPFLDQPRFVRQCCRP